MKPLCTVIVATYNRASLLERLLKSLEAQDVGSDAFEVIVVDDGSEDGTQEFLRSSSRPFRLTSFRQENAGPAAARNVAIRNASADLIVSIDDDVVAAPDLLRKHIDAHQGDGPICAFGAMVLPPGKRLEPWLEWEAMVLEKQYQEMKRGAWSASPRQFYTANASFDRALAVDAGLFDPEFRRAEDVEFAYRMENWGSSFRFLADAVVYHEPNRTYEQWLRVPRQYGYYDVVMATRKRRDFILKLAAADFRLRHAGIRLGARLLVGRGRLLSLTVRGASLLATLCSRAALRRVSFAAYSAIFNLEYWQSLALNLGGRATFWQMVESGLPPTPAARADVVVTAD